MALRSLAESRFWWFLLMLVALLVSSVLGWRLAHTVLSRSWPTVRGVVVASEAQPADKGLYKAHVEYRYTVNGIVYTGTVLGFAYDGLSTSFKGIDDILKNYRRGVGVNVHYQPDQPQCSVIDTSIPRHLAIFFAIVATFAVICYSGFKNGWLMSTKQRF